MEYKTDSLLVYIREGREMTFGQQLKLVVSLSLPAIIAQLSYIIMQYIDAAMVGSLGADASAAIGLVSTTTWLFGGLCVAATTGFSVQVAHRIGAGDFKGARSVLRQSIIATGLFSFLLAIIRQGICCGRSVLESEKFRWTSLNWQWKLAMQYQKKILNANGLSKRP